MFTIIDMYMCWRMAIDHLPMNWFTPDCRKCEASGEYCKFNNNTTRSSSNLIRNDTSTMCFPIPAPPPTVRGHRTSIKSVLSKPKGNTKPGKKLLTYNVSKLLNFICIWDITCFKSLIWFGYIFRHAGIVPSALFVALVLAGVLYYVIRSRQLKKEDRSQWWSI